jgi:hypothetical protein
MPIRVQYGQARGILRAVLEEARRAHEAHFHPRLRAFLEEGDTLGQALREALARRADREAASWVRELPEAVASWIRWLDELEAADRAAAARMRAAGGRRGP